MRALLTAGAFSLAFTLFLTPLFIRLFTRLGWGQFIRDDGPQEPPRQARHAHDGRHRLHPRQRSSATSRRRCSSRNEPPTVSAMLVLWMMVGLGVVGFIDDFMKTRKQRSLGLGGWRKIVGQVIVAAPFALLALQFPNDENVTPGIARASRSSATCRLDFMVLRHGRRRHPLRRSGSASHRRRASNGVNVTDGLDGLAGGAAILAIGVVRPHRLLAVQPVVLQRRT